MLWAHPGAPAGGAPTEDLIPATIVAVIALIALAMTAVAYRRGGARWLHAIGELSSKIGGLPTWAALPLLASAASLLIAVFGFYWDVSTHIDNGRDAGPFANPSHYFILFGLAGIALSGYLSVLFASDSKRTATFLGPAPIGGWLLTLCGVVAVAGFPLDDVWHRLFGQDVTLWGPTHIQMVGGAALTTLASWILLREARLETHGEGKSPRMALFDEPALAGAFLIGLSALQAEFDFGAPQFQLVYQPVLLMLAAGIALVAARVRLGPGGALKAVIFFLLIRGIVSVLVGPVLGRTVPHFPLYLVEALVVEALAWRVPTRARLRFALGAGALIGTIGLGAEWAWSHIWMDNPWPAELLPEGIVLGLLAAFAGAGIGVFIGGALERDTKARDVRPAFALGALGLMLFCLAYPAPTSPPDNLRADVSLESAGGAEGTAFIMIRPHPASIADDPIWFQALSWQGMRWNRGTKHLVQFEEIEPGTYRSVEALPVSGEWKTFIRLHNEGYLVATPVYMPSDPAIPAEGVPAQEQFTRPFVPDKELLQREALSSNLGLQRIGYSILAAIGLAWIAAFAWALRKLSADRGREE